LLVSTVRQRQDEIK